jgi:hypothetical protein
MLTGGEARVRENDNNNNKKSRKILKASAKYIENKRI